MPSNETAWLVAKHAPLQVREAPYPEAGAGEIVVKSRRHGLTVKFFYASSVIDNGTGPAIYRGYLGQALASRSFRPAPPPKVVGNSLHDIQAALEIQRRGVSAAKVVVALA